MALCYIIEDEFALENSAEHLDDLKKDEEFRRVMFGPYSAARVA